MKKTCVICGRDSGMYPLCKEHLRMKNEGSVIKCENCGTWRFADSVCACEMVKKDINTKGVTKCVICDNGTEGGWKYLCSNCYQNCLKFTMEMNKNSTYWDFKEYYYNLKTNIYRLTGFEKIIKPNCIKLVAIAKACSRYAHNDMLLDIVENDLKEIVAKKKQSDFIEETAEKRVVDYNTKKNMGNIRGVDGHFLDSDREKQIDDLLFSCAIPHAIHYSVPEINERIVNSDWYIPVILDKGIYVEYFGMDTRDYIKNREEKIDLYNKHKLKLIKIEKDEITDTAILKHKLMQEWHTLKNEILEEAKN